MPSVKLCASRILGEFEEAQSELVGKAVVLTEEGWRGGTRLARRVARPTNFDQRSLRKMADLDYQTLSLRRSNGALRAERPCHYFRP
jgi:hypothetical protein